MRLMSVHGKKRMHFLAPGSGVSPLLATALVYLSKWPLEQLDLATASAFAGLLVASST
jgi:hypothetical protein